MSEMALINIADIQSHFNDWQTALEQFLGSSDTQGLEKRMWWEPYDFQTRVQNRMESHRPGRSTRIATHSKIDSLRDTRGPASLRGVLAPAALAKHADHC